MKKEAYFETVVAEIASAIQALYIVPNLWTCPYHRHRLCVSPVGRGGGGGEVKGILFVGVRFFNLVQKYQADRWRYPGPVLLPQHLCPPQPSQAPSLVPQYYLHIHAHQNPPKNHHWSPTFTSTSIPNTTLPSTNIGPLL